MDNIRFALLCALGVLGFFLYQAWQADYPTAPTTPSQVQTANMGAQANATGDVPEAVATTAQATTAGKDAAAKQGVSAQIGADTQALAEGQIIHVATDKFKVAIDTRGGDVRSVQLREVAVSGDKPESTLDLINDTLPNFFIVQSGLSGQGAPTHNTTYTAQQDSYRLAPGQDVLRVPLTWHDDAGHKVTKIFTFHRGSYRIDLEHKVSNESAEPWTVSQYVRFWRTPHQLANSIPFSSRFLGVGWYQAVPGETSNYHYETRDPEDLQSDALSVTQQGGWIAMVQHYFIGAVVPPADAKVRYYAQPKAVPGSGGEGFDAGFISAHHTVAPGQTTDLKTTLFIGPKLDDQLAAVAPGLDLTVNYGWFTIVAKPIFWVLEKLHTLVGNWGVAIILLTVLIKALFYKLSEKQYRAMARMRKFAPRMQQLKEKYGDDKQQLQAKMMDLYKKEGFNPLAGCWPMLVQMPVFIALYWVLRGTVELRLVPFLWIPDLSAPDPFYILPIIFGAGMFLQQRLQTSITMDPMQQRMMQIMPLGMAVFFAFFPAGLVLYYCVNTLLSITQQWYIYRKLDAEGLGHSAPAK